MTEENKSVEDLPGMIIVEKNNFYRLAFKMKLHKGQEAEYKKGMMNYGPNFGFY